MFALITCAVLGLASLCAGQEVNTFQGKLRGITLNTHSGRNIFAFLGVPYAKPPTGSLRFQPPKPPVKWEGTRAATEEGSRCPQLSYPERKYEGSEDCLYLNVFTPRLPNATSVTSSLLDVIVLIHSGGFTHGSGDIAMYGPDYLLDYDVVLVTFNYRLGALGFLATGDTMAGGNYGLKDQVDVLRWVRRNIPYFSGNPNSVTLLGAEAGGASVHLHKLSGLSRALFHKAVSQSGTALSPWATVSSDVARQRALKLGKVIGCKQADLVECLRNASAQKLVEASTQVMDFWTDFTYPFVPVERDVVEHNAKPFLHDTPVNIMSKPLYGMWEIPWLVSVTSHEGLPQSLHVMVYPHLMDRAEEHVLQFLGLAVEPPEKARKIARKIWDFYMQNETLSYGNLIKLVEMVGDYKYYYGLMQSIRLLVPVSDVPVFVYCFSYNRHNSPISLGVPQGEDTLYMFPNIVAGEKSHVEAQHFHVTEQLLDILTTFAHFGDPTPEESPFLNGSLWPTASPDNFQYIDIGKTLSIQDFYPTRIKFWDEIYKLLSEDNAAPHDEL